MEFVLTDGTWHSTISFDENTPVNIAGDLKLEIDSNDPASLVGTTFQLFDWTGASRSGEFTITSDPGYASLTNNLYTDGTVTLLAVPEPSSIALLACFTALSAMKSAWMG